MGIAVLGMHVSRWLLGRLIQPFGVKTGLVVVRRCVGLFFMVVAVVIVACGKFAWIGLSYVNRVTWLEGRFTTSTGIKY